MIRFFRKLFTLTAFLPISFATAHAGEAISDVGRQLDCLYKTQDGSMTGTMRLAIHQLINQETGAVLKIEGSVQTSVPFTLHERIWNGADYTQGAPLNTENWEILKNEGVFTAYNTVNGESRLDAKSLMEKDVRGLLSRDWSLGHSSTSPFTYESTYLRFTSFDEKNFGAQFKLWQQDRASGQTVDVQITCQTRQLP